MSIIFPEPDAPSYSPWSTSEVEYQRRITKAFIDSDPISLSLSRPLTADDGEGGRIIGSSSNIEMQTFRLIPQSDVMPQVQTPDGFQLTPTYVILGEYDCDLERWDRFSVAGVDFQVVSPVRPDHSIANVYERKADVARI